MAMRRRDGRGRETAAQRGPRLPAPLVVGAVLAATAATIVVIDGRSVWERLGLAAALVLAAAAALAFASWKAAPPAREPPPADTRDSTDRRYRKIVQRGWDVTGVLDASGRVRFVSASASRVFGAEPATLEGRLAVDLVHPADRGRILELLDSLLAEPAASVTARARVRHRDGRWVSVEVSAVNLLDDPDVGGVLCHGRDISERERVLEQLRASEERYRQMFEANPHPMWVYDLDTLAFLAVNDAAVAHYGYARDEFLAMTIRDIRPTEDVPALLENVAAVTGGIDEAGVWRHRLKDGRLIEVEISSHGLAFEGRRAEVVLAHDVTERRRAEAEVRRLSVALEAAANAIVLTEKDGSIVWANPAFSALSGYALAEAVGRTPGELQGSGRHDQAFFAQMWETILAGRVWRGEMVNRRKDGSLYTEEMTITPVRDERGAITHFVAIKQDVTAQRELETQLRHSQKLEAIGRLAGGVAHDFNNMLAVILGFGDLALRRLERSDPLHKNVREMVHAAERSADLTRQLLAFARKQTFVLKVVDVGDTLSAMQGMLARLAGEDVELHIEPSRELWRVRIDPGQLAQILTNLVTNSRDAIADVGTITLATRNARFGGADLKRHPEAAPGDYVVLSVRDTGAGMHAATLERIFEPFFTTKPEGKGTGLGLATVFGIVRQSGGFIDVASELGKGTTIEVCLPRYLGAKEAAEARGAQPAPRGGETVLVVEDEPQLLELAQEGLVSLGYDVLAAGSPRQALMLAERHAGPLQLLVTDVVMPGMNGVDLKERLEKLRPGLRVVFMSGYASDVLGARGLADREFHFVQKPFTLEALAARVREALDA